MKNILSIDGWYFRVFSRLANLIILNLLFIVSILPIVTIGIGGVALIKSLNELKSDGTLSAFKVYTNYFRLNFKKGMILLGVELIGWLVPTSLIYVSLKYIPLLSTLLMILFSFFLLLLIVFPLVFALNDLRVKEAIRGTLEFVTIRLPYAIAMFLVLIGISFLSLKYSIIFMFLVGVALVVNLQISLMKKGLASYGS
ncbi:DUF624 domain-containing protein [Vagococcus sp. DIV0080]|uniref:DUF624 domain-containing protein n=1 Tax=Candidatus Vagococcus giribetii TaxID=2230876 RepID=A0ABS3HV49_9ENTE|nr:DUF624 domain-containing protein [Vagococcus sp. DIV0080]MBO0477628.1 DUF624 domain-containing protein [Vagococcus sp. DIV0080]